MEKSAEALTNSQIDSAGDAVRQLINCLRDEGFRSYNVSLCISVDHPYMQFIVTVDHHEIPYSFSGAGLLEDATCDGKIIFIDGLIERIKSQVEAHTQKHQETI